jgi:peptidoglycan/LPS O-acetylase OafA/YrhL
MNQEVEVSRERLDYVDVLRCLAILGVILVHVGGLASSGLPLFLKSIISRGARGVQLFYLMSAFTIVLTFIRHKKTEKKATTNFYIRRFFRIAPLFYLAIAYYLFQDGLGPRYWLGDAPGISVGNVLATIFFVNGANPYWITSIVPGGWSIAVEMSFYFIVPLLLKFIKNLKTATIFFFISVFIRFILHLVLSKNMLISSPELWANYLFIYFPNQLPIFILGIILYYLFYEKRGDKFRYLFVLIVPSLILQLFVKDTSLILLGLSFMGLAALLRKYLPSNLLTRAMVYLGKISYSMYLVHFAVIFWLSKFLPLDYFGGTIAVKYASFLNFGIWYIIVCLVTAAISSITFKYIEKPFISLGRRLIKARELGTTPVGK